MSDEYTPTTDWTPNTEQVRSHYVFNQSNRWDAERGEAFDRWLADFEAKVRADQIEKDAAIAGDLASKHGMYLFGGGWSSDAGMTKVARAIRAQLNGENDE